jgi:hypothetical protein
MGTMRHNGNVGNPLPHPVTTLQNRAIYRVNGRIYQWFDNAGLYETDSNGTRLVYSVTGNVELNAIGVIVINAIVRAYGLA